MLTASLTAWSSSGSCSSSSSNLSQFFLALRPAVALGAVAIGGAGRGTEEFWVCVCVWVVVGIGADEPGCARRVGHVSGDDFASLISIWRCQSLYLHIGRPRSVGRPTLLLNTRNELCSGTMPPHSDSKCISLASTSP
jgi:hypothetical protein